MEMETVQPEMIKPMTSVDLPKSKAQQIKVGQQITYTVVGKVTGIRESYHDQGKPNTEGKYCLDVEVDEVKDLMGNTADVEYAKLKEVE